VHAEELSPEEERHISNLSVIPAAVLTYILVALFVYVGHDQQHFTLWYYLIYFGLPFVIAVPATIFIAFEILYSRKTGKPVRCYAKRLTGRMMIMIAGVSIFFGILGATYFALPAWVDQWNVLLLSGIVWFAIWIVLVWRFRRIFDRLYRGQW
jgi:hypothetical protein